MDNSGPRILNVIGENSDVFVDQKTLDVVFVFTYKGGLDLTFIEVVPLRTRELFPLKETKGCVSNMRGCIILLHECLFYLIDFCLSFNDFQVSVLNHHVIALHNF